MIRTLSLRSNIIQGILPFQRHLSPVTRNIYTRGYCIIAKRCYEFVNGEDRGTNSIKRVGRRFSSVEGDVASTNKNQLRDTEKKVCVIVGTGEGIGSALARKFCRGGYITVVVRRNKALLQQTVIKIENQLKSDRKDSDGEKDTREAIFSYQCDAREEDQVVKMFQEVESNYGPVSVCIFNVGANISFPLLETTSRKFRKCWEMACFSGFLVGKEAAKYMVPRKTGTILFTGATASKRGAATFAAFSAAKSGLRSLAQSMARELSPFGVHVAHVVIDGAVDTPWIRQNFRDHIAKFPPDGLCQPDEIAEVFWQLSQQHRSVWTHEIDVRPYCEHW